MQITKESRRLDNLRIIVEAEPLEANQGGKQVEIVVIYQQDGTLQCRTDPKPRPLEHDEALLKKHGVQTIYASGNVPGPNAVPARCGCPTAQVNAFAISGQDWDALQAGIVGTLGFELWVGAPLPDLGWPESCRLHPQPFPYATITLFGCNPVLIRDLIGLPCRCYRRGDPVTDDYRPERVNIEKDQDDRITRVWFG